MGALWMRVSFLSGQILSEGSSWNGLLLSFILISPFSFFLIVSFGPFALMQHPYISLLFLVSLH